MLKLFIYKLKKPYHLIKTGFLKGLPAQYQYHHPERSLQIIMVTGTDGKTTTATLLHHIFTKAGIQTGLITTVSAKIGNQEIETGLHVTAPQPDQLYLLLSRMKDEGCTHVVLEMTSHGSHQARNWGVRPKLGIITNITPEHLDYHVNFNEYALAKFKLFKNCPTIILSPEIASMSSSLHSFKKNQLIVLPKLSNLPPKIRSSIQGKFPEKYNQSNALMCWLAARHFGINTDNFISALSSFSGVKGRMNRLNVSTKFSVIVDFAHTSAGVKAVLTALRQELKTSGHTGRLISILGCAGQRDRSKRPMMGFLAAKISDISIFTAEDPRTEDIWSIIRQMKEQLKTDHNRVVSIADRGEAIYYALTHLVRPHDIVVILGKGHEKSMCLGKIEHPWSDEQAVKAVIIDKIVPRVGHWQPLNTSSSSP